MHTTPALPSTLPGAPGVYALFADRRLIALRSQLPLISGDQPTAWIHVAMEGEWTGHPSGAFAFTAETFDEVIRNHDAQSNAIPLDYEHASEFAIPAPACGWVHSFEVREQGGVAHLWALVEFDDEAAAYVKRGAYRFCSGVFDFGATDRATGEPIGCRMRSIALTNQPFIDGQEPIRLSQRAHAHLPLGDPMLNKAALIEGLTSALENIEGEELDAAQVHQIVEALSLLAAAQDAPEEPEEPADMADGPDDSEDEEIPLTDAPVAAAEEGPPEMPVAELEEDAAPDAGAMIASRLMESTGLDAAALLAALDEQLEAVTAALLGTTTETESAPLSDRLAAQQVTITSLSARLRDFEAAEQRVQAEALRLRNEKAAADVEALIARGVLAEAGRAAMTAVALSDRAQFDALAESLTPVVPTTAHASATTNARGADATLPDDISDEDVADYRRRYLTNLPGQPRSDSELDALARERLRVLGTRKTSRRVAAVQ